MNEQSAYWWKLVVMPLGVISCMVVQCTQELMEVDDIFIYNG